MAYSGAEDVLDMVKTDLLRTILADVLQKEYPEEYVEDLKVRELALPYAGTAVADADSEIDGYLAKRYRVPLTRVPKMIGKLSKDIAVYNLASRAGIDEDDREKNILNRYKAAIVYLTNVAKGIVDIEGAVAASGTDPDAQVQGNSGFAVRSNTRLFSRDTMRGW